MIRYALTRSDITAVLDTAGITHVTDIDGDHYITNLAMPFWITLDQDAGRVALLSNCPFRREVSELEALRCANRLNATYACLQFYLKSTGECLHAMQELSFAEGIVEEELLRAVWRFPGAFKAAIEEPGHRDLFIPFGGAAEREGDAVETNEKGLQGLASLS